MKEWAMKDWLASFVMAAAAAYAIYQIAMGAAEKVFKRDIEPQIKALEQSIDTLRGEKKGGSRINPRPSAASCFAEAEIGAYISRSSPQHSRHRLCGVGLATLVEEAARCQFTCHASQ